MNAYENLEHRKRSWFPSPGAGRSPRPRRRVASVGFPARTCRTRVALTLLGGVVAWECLAAPAGFPEPPMILYGQVFQASPEGGFQLLEGQLRLCFVNPRDAANQVTFQTDLRRTGQGGLYSYVLEIPVKYLPARQELQSVLSTSAATTSYAFGSVTVDGVAASPLDPTVDSFLTSFGRRAQMVRLDLRVALPWVDSDGDGMPDRWEQRYGLNPLAVEDAMVDRDGDGQSNLQEFLGGTSPVEGAGTTQLRTTRIAIAEGGTAGLWLSVSGVDRDPQQVRITVQPSAGFRLGDAATGLEAASTFTLQEVRAGRLRLVHTGSSLDSGTLRVTINSGTNAVLQAAIDLALYRPSLTDGTDASLWLDAQQITGVEPEQPLGVWSDRSGNQNHAQQTASASQPVYRVDRQGKAAVGFADSRHFVLPDRAFPSADGCLFAVYDSGWVAGEQQIVSANRIGLSVEPVDPQLSYPGAQVLRKGGLAIHGRQNTRGRTVITSARFQGESGTAYVDGRFDGSREAESGREAAVIPTVGVRRFARTSGWDRPFHGVVRELLVFPAALDELKDRRVSDYLASKWLEAVIWDCSDEGMPVELRTAHGRNVLRGGHGPDVLVGGDGEDVLSGGPGDDRLTGGPACDRFVYGPRDTGRDVICDFEADGEHPDVLDLSRLFPGRNGDVRGHLSLRFEVTLRGEEVVGQSILSVRLDPGSSAVDREIALQGCCLTDADLPWLVGEGVIDAGDLRVPTQIALVADTASLREDGTESALVRVVRQGEGTGRLRVPLFLGGTARAGADYEVVGDAGATQRHEVVLERGETEKVVRLTPKRDRLAEGDETAMVVLLPRADYARGNSSVAIVLVNGTSLPTAYKTWAEQHAPPDAPAALGEGGADFDADGASNLLEFLCGTEPTDARSSPADALRIGLEDGHAVLRFLVQDRPGTLSIQVLASGEAGASYGSDPGAFSVEQESTVPGVRAYRFRSTYPVLGPLEKQFYRIMIHYGED